MRRNLSIASPGIDSRHSKSSLTRYVTCSSPFQLSIALSHVAISFASLIRRVQVGADRSKQGDDDISKRTRWDCRTAAPAHGVLPIPISSRGLILANTDSDIIIIVLVVLASEAENEIS